jgi:hypothetical protein
MTNRRSHPDDHVHFAPGFAGTLRWMGYWTSSRSANTRRALRQRWLTHVRPALGTLASGVRSRTTTALPRSPAAEGPRTYESLAEAVRQREWADARG